MDTTNIKKNAVLNAFKAVTKDTNNRPVLQCICFSKNGYTVATNGKILLKVDKTHYQTEGDFLFNLQTGLPDAGNYPVIDQIIPKDCGIHANIAAGDLAGLLAFLKPLKANNVSLTFNDGITFTTDHGSYMLASELENADLLKDCKITVNASYLSIAVTLFNAIKAAPIISFSNAWHNGAINELSPFAMTYEQFTFIICPLRVRN